MCFGSKLLQQIGHQACYYQLANSFGTLLKNRYQGNKTHQDLWHLFITQGADSLLKDIALPSAEVCSILLIPAGTRIMLAIFPLSFILFLSASLSPCHTILCIFDRLASQHSRSSDSKDHWTAKPAQEKGQEPAPGYKVGTTPPCFCCCYVTVFAHPL